MAAATSIKVRINDIQILDGKWGPWSKALASIEDVTDFDVIQVTKIDLDEAREVQGKLQAVKSRGMMLTCSGEFLSEEREETFVSKKTGEQVTQQVLYLRLMSTPKWGLEPIPTLKGNLSELLADINTIESDNDPI